MRGHPGDGVFFGSKGLFGFSNNLLEKLLVTESLILR